MKKYALIAGADKSNRAHYGIEETSVEITNNVNNMFHLLKTNYHFPITKDGNVLKGEDASFFNFKTYLKAINVDSEGKDSFLIIYLAGHSYGYKKEPSEEPYVFFSFYEQLIEVDTIVGLLEEIGSNFKVLFIFDTCSAASLAKNITQNIKAEIIPLRGGINHFLNIYRNGINDIYFNTIVDDYKNITRKESKIKLKAETLFYFAVGEYKITFGEGSYGMTFFTTRIIKTFERWKCTNMTDRSYLDFFNELDCGNQDDKCHPNGYKPEKRVVNQKRDFFHKHSIFNNKELNPINNSKT